MRVRWGTALVLLALLPIAACGDDGGSNSGSDPGGVEATTTTGAPKSGGVLTFAEYSEPRGLDPIVSTGAGVTGAIEMSAIYDTIMRWNPETGEYEERTAESLESNADFTEWTLKLKPGIQFHDGTPYNADAVIFGMMRHKSGTPGAPPCAELYACPRNATSSNVYMQLVKSMDKVDDLTVKFTLTEPWSAFAYALSDEASMIPSPTALKAACADPTADVAQCSFNLAPVGAGPFKIESFKPKDSITMARNDSYYGGDVYLDGLKFVNPGDAGGAKTYEGFKAGTYNVAFLRDPQSTVPAHDDGVQGYSAIQQGGALILMNMGVTITCRGGQPAPMCAGQADGAVIPTTPPTASAKVREAIAAAINPEVINDRAYGGDAHAGSALLQDSFRWYPEVDGPEFNLENAKKLVEEAKAGGWNGQVRMLYTNAPTAQAVSLAVQTMLQAAGIDVSTDNTKDTTQHIATIAVQKDFDMSGWGVAISSDDGAMAALAQNFSSTSASNRVGYKNPKVDQALKDLRAAPDDKSKTAAFEIIASEIARDLPVLPFAAIEELIVWQDDVHGLVFNHSTSVHLDKAWIG